MLDKEIKSMLSPLNLMHNILMFPKYRIKNNSIYPNRLKHFKINIPPICATLLLIYLFSIRIHSIHCSKNSSLTSYLSVSYEFTAFTFSLILNFMINVLYSRSNIYLVFKLQEVHRILSDDCFNYFVIWNWISAVLVITVYICITIFNSLIVQWPIKDLLYGFAFLCFDIDYVYAIRLIRFLSRKVDIWNSRVQNLGNIDNNEMQCKAMFQCYLNILECYNLVKKSYQQLVSFTSMFYVVLSKV